MAKQDEWIRITLRIPGDLHSKLVSAADENNRSMNAEIIATLELVYPERAEIADPLIGSIAEDDLLGILDDVDRLRQRLLAKAVKRDSEKAKK